MCKTQVSSELVSGEASLPDLQTATFLPCPHVASTVSARAQREKQRERFGVSSSSYKNTIPTGLGPYPYDLF